jgi:hypothetical protein
LSVRSEPEKLFVTSKQELGLNAVAMLELAEWAPNLLIAEVAVPRKFGDAG